MKILLFTVVTLTMIYIGEGKAITQDQAKKALVQYPYDVRVECTKLNSHRDRKSTYINYVHALQCADQYMVDARNIREQEARIELMESMTKRSNRVQRW
jgi:hypothetical protein